MIARRAALVACAGVLALPLVADGAAVSADPDPATSLSTPRRDPYYPRVGSPVVDALHYDLDLTWRRAQRRLVGHETLTFRAAQSADTFALDLGASMTVTAVEVDGVAVDFRRPDHDLIVEQPVVADATRTVTIDYDGPPQPVKAPSVRSDVETVGFHTTRTGRVWAMQEPYGAFTWYAVDDQPADKATYDISITAPAGWKGVSGGVLTGTETGGDGRVTTHWHLGSPTASYLTTIAIGPYRHRTVPGTDTVPRIDIWALAGDIGRLTRTYAKAGEALAWLERRLGPYPFDSLGILTVTGSTSAMETQTMVTIGDTPYATSPDVILHEFSHQWYGDLMTPSVWSDVWMNEGMATYLQAVWSSTQPGGTSMKRTLRDWASYDGQLRAESGAPAAFYRRHFGSSNVYYCAALMWARLRERLGSPLFWRLVREWPRSQSYGNGDYASITAWWSEQSGQDLSAFFRRWLLSTRSPTGS